jgi:predicted Zn-dependent protease
MSVNSHGGSRLNAWSERLEVTFAEVASRAFSSLHEGESLSLALSAESSQFLRFNNARVRQVGTVDDASLLARFMAGGRQVVLDLSFTADIDSDAVRLERALETARRDAREQPVDEAIVLPSSAARSRSVTAGTTPAPERAADILLSRASSTDMCGLYAGGPIARAVADSAGQSHWFAAENFFVDYSLWHRSGKAVKSGYAGARFVEEEWVASLADAKAQLAALDLPTRRLEPGSYRAWLEPAALGDILSMFSWHGLSERALRQKESAFLSLREGRARLSPLFTLRESFLSGLSPRFTAEGDLAPEETILVREGALAEAMVSSRTGKEYGIPHNGATAWESLRSPVVDAGSLPTGEALARLGTGLYLPNLHYLNWSDVQSARITGMTRYACLWVEEGRYIGPIADLRFDDTIYNILGDRLEALSKERRYVPETGTYGTRNLGGMLLPGALVRELRFTL